MDDFGTLETGFNAEFGSEANTATTDYDALTNKPSINGVELSGDKSTEDLGIEIPAKVSELENDAGYQTQTDVVNLRAEGLPIVTTVIANNKVNTDVIAPILQLNGKSTIVQTGSGTVSPTNVRPYRKYTSLSVTINGKTHTRTFEKALYGFDVDLITGRYGEDLSVHDEGIVGVELAVNTKGVPYIKTDSIYTDAVKSTSMYRKSTAGINQINSGYFKHAVAEGIIYIFDSRFTDLATANDILKDLQYELSTREFRYFENNLEPIRENMQVGDNNFVFNPVLTTTLSYCKRPIAIPAVSLSDKHKFLRVNNNGNYSLSVAPILITVNNTGSTPTITIPSPYTESDIVSALVSGFSDDIEITCEFTSSLGSVAQLRATGISYLPTGIVFNGIVPVSSDYGMTAILKNVTVFIYMKQFSTLTVEVTEKDAN